MKLIVGLGNPGKKYERTRHNAGFIAIDELANQLNISLTKSKFNGVYGDGVVNGEKVILLKPLTYMNLSGESIVPMMNYLNIDLDDLMVIYDDLDLPTGKVRLRVKGGTGGHNGLKSIKQHTGSTEFKRIRLGIGRPVAPIPVVDYVLGQFNEEETLKINDAVEHASNACQAWLEMPFIDVMNKYN
ncbi:aminoacyl-tRNA hydrolase [Bacillus solimangrovi]|uniref:Peptidyl-tRNA hydrolase n=1 Tax=Bacillus solimangrovi TaxID=1305675 RepID=A0A1E5LEY3_9BACI|nr:aminoacyl-tRNA hydrolase [Bacillus solimangrovi]OEH92633.1 aminoacyl-tRNA hydrolase [Bacillus solimangrovi]